MSLRTCPRPACAELNAPDAETCHACGAALIPNGGSRPSHRLAVVLEQATQLQTTAADLDDDTLSRHVAQLSRHAFAAGNRLSFLEATTTAATRSDLDSRSAGGRRGGKHR